MLINIFYPSTNFDFLSILRNLQQIWNHPREIGKLAKVEQAYRTAKTFEIFECMNDM